MSAGVRLQERLKDKSLQSKKCLRCLSNSCLALGFLTDSKISAGLVFPREFNTVVLFGQCDSFFFSRKKIIQIEKNVSLMGTSF